MDEARDIFVSIKYGNSSKYYSLIDRVDINIRNSSGDTLLHVAIASRKFDIAEDLIHREIDINIVNTDGQSAAHYLSYYPNENLTKRLLEKGIIVNLQDRWGNTPFWYAIYNGKGNYSLVKLFMDFGADPEIINKVGKSSLDFANSKKIEELNSLLNRIV